jgi:hypothetical protein
MATTITTGNSTNGGAIISSDNTGILELKTGSGSGTTALTIGTGQAATFAGTLQVAGVSTNMYPLVSGTAVTLTTQTNVDFTSIPPWVRRITVMFNGVSLTGTDALLVQIGDSGGIETTGYSSAAAFTGSSTGGNARTDGYVITLSQNASNTFAGAITIVNISGNTWVQTGNLIYESTTPTGFVVLSAGTKTLSAQLNQVSITRTGTNTFDAGTINLLWE